MTNNTILDTIILLMLTANLLLLLGHTLPGVVLGFLGIIVYGAERLSYYKRKNDD